MQKCCGEQHKSQPDRGHFTAKCHTSPPIDQQSDALTAIFHSVSGFESSRSHPHEEESSLLTGQQGTVTLACHAIGDVFGADMWRMHAACHLGGGNIVTNGAFESSSFLPGWVPSTPLDDGQQFVSSLFSIKTDGPTAPPSSPRLPATGLPAQYNNTNTTFAAFTGTDAGIYSSISQNLTTVPGCNYLLSFYLITTKARSVGRSAPPNTVASNANFGVSVDGDFIAVSGSYINPNTGNPTALDLPCVNCPLYLTPWAPFQGTFTAYEPVTTLSFVGFNGRDFFGFTVVSVTSI